MNNLLKVARKFQAVLAQQSSVQAGEIADDFPKYFPSKGGGTSPMMQKLDAFLSTLLPEDMNAAIDFLVLPGFKTNFHVLLTKGGTPVQNAKIAGSILKFLANEMRNFTVEAKAKYAGRNVADVLVVATHTI